MKIVSWNIERGYRPEETCRLLAELSADVCLLTEVDRGNRRTGGVDMFALLQERLGMAGRFALEFTEKESLWRRVIPLGGPGGGVHGNAVFARQPLENYRELRLPTAAPLHWDGSTLVPELFEPRSGARVAQVFELRVAGRSVSFINVHLENWRCGWDLRRRQLETALAAAPGPRVGAPGPERVLAGDLNPLGGVAATFAGLAPVSREVRTLRAFLAERGLGDPWADEEYTNFNYGTRAKLDWLCVSPGLVIEEKRSLRTPLSDHNCLLVRVGVSAGVGGAVL